MDALSAALNELRLETNRHCRIDGAGAWGVRYATGPMTSFHVVLRGRALIETASGERHELDVGDCILLPGGDAHVVRDPDSRRTASDFPFMHELIEARNPDARDAVTVGAGDSTVSYLCGVFRFTRHESNPILQALPPVVVTRGCSDMLAWVDSQLAPAAREVVCGAPGADLVLSRLWDVLLVRMLRNYLASLPGAEANWLTALQDVPIGRALAAIHRHPERPWTVESLGVIAGMSRSRFSARFAALVGQPPLTYLTTWRMWRARVLLREGRLRLIEIAQSLGYQSEAAFSVAFTRAVGTPPGRYRRAA